MAIVVAEQIVAHLEAQRAGDTATGVAGHEQVIGTFMRIGIAHQSAARADGVELLVAPGDEFMRINLVSGVPDEAITAEVEGQVKGKTQLDDTEIAGEVSWPDAQDAHELVAHFLSEFVQLLIGEFVQVGRRGYLREQRSHGVCP